MNKEIKILTIFIIIFLIMYFLPLTSPKVQKGILEAFNLLQWYIRNHTLACVIPALFIAGAFITFLSQNDIIIKYLGVNSNKLLAYIIASLSGTILAVCSCSVLPIFAGIYTLGAGIGPATAFLYSGPAINILAIFLSARVLGIDIGIARFIGSVLFALIIGVLMEFIFYKEEKKRVESIIEINSEADKLPNNNENLNQNIEGEKIPIKRIVIFISLLILFLVFSDWYNPGNVIIFTKKGEKIKGVILIDTKDEILLQLKQNYRNHKKGEKIKINKKSIKKINREKSWVIEIYNKRLYIVTILGIIIIILAKLWIPPKYIKIWIYNTWDFSKLIVPLLFIGIFIVGFLTPILPDKYIVKFVGENTIFSNFFSAIIGAFFYFATLTEVPIVQSLMKLGMHKGPALSLLLAGPALSLPNMLVIGGILGTKKTLTFIILVVIMSTFTGYLFGTFF